MSDCEGKPRFCPQGETCPHASSCWRSHTTLSDVHFLPAPQFPPKEARRRGSAQTMSQTQLDSYGEGSQKDKAKG